MTATFTAWHAEATAPDQAAFYLTAINVQEVGRGCRAFIEMVLEALDWDRAFPDEWSVGNPFAVDFLSSERTDNWHDSWLLTWRIELRASVLPDLPAGPLDLTVWDESWAGDEADPTAFEVVAVAGKSAQRPQLPSADDDSWRCSLGHLHVQVPVVRSSLDAAAAAAAEIRDRLNERGWFTDWLGSQDL